MTFLSSKSGIITLYCGFNANLTENGNESEAFQNSHIFHTFFAHSLSPSESA